MRSLRRRLFVAGVAASLCLYLLVGWLLTFDAHFFIGDTLARIANAYYIVFSRDPHLAAVGFGWLPLPSFFELPFVILLKPFGAITYSGAIVTALFSAANIVLLRRLLNRIGLTGLPCTLLVAVYALNPFVIFYAANGMSEALFITTILLLADSMIAWRDTGAPSSLLSAGIACAIAWGIRFEALAIFGAGVAAITLVWWVRYRNDMERLEGEQLAFILPFAFVVAMWVLANWLITGSPLYFLNGSGNSAANSLLQLRTSNVASLYHHVLPSLEYVVIRCEWFMPALLPLVALAIALYAWQRRPLDLIPLAFPAAVLLFHVYMLYDLKSYGEFRYYCYSLPLGVVAAALVIVRVPLGKTRRTRLLRKLAIGVVLAGVAFSFPSTLLAMNNAAIGRQETPLMELIRGHQTPLTTLGQWRNEQRMAAYVDGLQFPKGSVVLDTTAGFAIDIFSRHPTQFIVPSDYDWEADVSQLSQFHGYVLVSNAQEHESLLIEKQYPALLSNGVPWAHLQHRIGPWLLYRISA